MRSAWITKKDCQEREKLGKGAEGITHTQRKREVRKFSKEYI